MAARDPKTWARRLKILRPFTRWLRQFEPYTEVPDEAIFGSAGERLTPHIYSEQEIANLLAAAGQLQPPRRGATYETLFGLLAATGLRLSEAVHLCQGDVDPKHGVLDGASNQIRQVAPRVGSSNHLGGVAPLPRAVRSGHRRHRGVAILRGLTRTAPRAQTLATSGGPDLSAVARAARLGQCGAHAAPRVHDLRHTFVVRRILLWQAQGVDIDQRMLALSTYVGHAHVTDTYWYLSAVPVMLMAVAAECFEARSYVAEVACD